MVLLRFAPSPTGALHLGGLRTALLNHLYARKLGGKWILRMEDTDQTRLVQGSFDDIRAGLEWAGLDYDYGPDRPGPHGPYFQSQRLDLYHEHARKLLDSGHAYRCFCSVDKLADTRSRLLHAGSNATYDRACLHLSVEETARRVRAGEKSVIRIKVMVDPNSGIDMIFGKHREATSSQATDSILVKADNFPTYHFASVVDDHHMGITHVVRGEEWLSSLPLHLRIYSALSFRCTKMSKRKGDVRVSDYMKQGWEPEAVVNWLALVGWGRHKDPIPIKFDLSQTTHRRNILDPGKLRFLNKQHLQLKASNPNSFRELAKRALDMARTAFPGSDRVYHSGDFDITYIEHLLPAVLERLENFNDLPASAPYFFVDPDFGNPDARRLRKTFSLSDHRTILNTTYGALLKENLPNFTPESIRQALKNTRLSLGLRQPEYMDSLRHALTGTSNGPSVVDIIHILGRERSMKRLISSVFDTRIN
ncbi:hypothetical protein BS47DRAFT_1372416 [Hydnum rufescens UP504]|uniref:Glutamate--tRNA ligase n=1 Tax=Hydnum rufescens UP504 TaxID=1448309 RepID=A0A9P6DU51_9AGAM|nr:hypothetical protein BS47DRAFT_1372416 [Hydnum rufescens UP504]